jgi:hypothetical protein
MTTQAAVDLQTYYSGTVADKLAVAQELYARHAVRLTASPLFQKELDLLQHHAVALGGHMQSMDLGRLCSHCAARDNGGCCSAYMAGNTDALLLLINMLLGIQVQYRNIEEENCCFLDDQGCLFLVKPIFCLNYNCKNILDSAESGSLKTLYRLAATVLSQQTKVESLLLATLSDFSRSDKQVMRVEGHDIF